MRGLEKTTVMRYAVELRMPLVRIQCIPNINFYIQFKKKDVHMLNKFSISIDTLDVLVAVAIPPKVGESNTYLCNLLGLVDKVMKPCNL